jgi:uncharacterized protein YxjI
MAVSTIPELESSDRFLVQQVFKPIANEYRISVPTPGSSDEGRPVLFVKQKKMKIREDIRFRASQDDAAPHAFMIKARTVFEFRGRHDVLDAEDNSIGLLEKSFGLSLLRSHWHVKDPNGTELFEAHESSWLIAIVRRFADLGPDWFSLLTWLPFNFTLKRRGEQVGTYKRVLGTLRDRYLLELEPGFDADRRLAIAFAIALDALQDRESARTASPRSACTDAATYTVHGCAGVPPVYATTGVPRACAYQASIAVPSSGAVNAASTASQPSISSRSPSTIACSLPSVRPRKSRRIGSTGSCPRSQSNSAARRRYSSA